MTLENYFGPLPKSKFDPSLIESWLKRRTISAAKLVSGTVQAAEIIIADGGVIQSENYAAGVSGWIIDGDGSAEFNDVEVRGDIVSSNWDGADPADLSAGPDLTATEGFYMDSSAGAAQFTGPVYFQPPDESTEGSGELFNFGDGFFMRVYQDNPTTGEDTLWFGNTINQDGVDHVVIGPSAGANYFKRIRMRSDGFEVQGDGGILRFDINSSADGGDIVFKDIADATILEWDESQDSWDFGKAITFDGIAAGVAREVIDMGAGYEWFQDNTGSGASGNRAWMDAPNNGEIIFGPRAGNEFLDMFRILSEQIRFSFVDSGGDEWSHTFPKGIIYDFASDTTTGEATSGAYPSDISGLACTVNVPQDISVTILVWGHIRLDQSADNGEIVFFEIQVGGTAPVLPAASELDLTTGSGGTGNTGANGAQLISISGTSGGASAGTAHTHSTGSYNPSDVNDHTHTGPSHTHSLSAQFKTIPYVGMRSFTPTGTTVTIQAVGGGTSGAITYDDGLIMAMVVVN